MANSNVDFQVGDAMKQITLNVRLRGLSVLSARIRMGIALLKFAAWVIGCHVDIEMSK